MEFNGNLIKVFSQEYAYQRTLGHEIAEDITQLKQNLEYHFGDCKNYSEGDAFPHEIWNMYPENIAILIRNNKQYMLQVCSKYRVGKLYKNIQEHRNEIQAFFEQNEGNAILLDNSAPAVTIYPQYAFLVAYVEKMTKFQEEVDKIRNLYFSCKRTHHELKAYQSVKNLYIPQKQIDFISKLAKEFLDECSVIKIISNDAIKKTLEDIVIPLPRNEATGILFALFLYHYRENASCTKLADSFRIFVAKHPEAEEYFRRYQSKLDATILTEELKILNSKNSFGETIADEILS